MFFSRNQGLINPYKLALTLMLSRINWDIQPIARRQHRKIIGWKNKYLHQKALILCNGPSLKNVDLEQIQASGVFTIGLNKIHLLFEKTSFRPSIIVAVNPHVIRQSADAYHNLQIPLFLDYRFAKELGEREHIHYITTDNLCGHFAQDCSLSINQGYTVTYVAMQLAFHMGFSQVGLVGCDHYFSTKGPSNSVVTSGEHDPNHFSPDYFANGATWQLPDLVGSEFHYEMARRTFEENQRELVNCTDGGQLDLLSRVPLETFLPPSQHHNP